MLAAAYKELFPAGTAIVSKAVEITGDPSGMPPELSLRILVERETPSSGEGCSIAICASAATSTSRASPT